METKELIYGILQLSAMTLIIWTLACQGNRAKPLNPGQKKSPQAPLASDYLHWHNKFRQALAKNDLHAMEEANYEMLLIERSVGIQGQTDIIERAFQMNGISQADFLRSQMA